MEGVLGNQLTMTCVARGDIQVIPIFFNYELLSDKSLLSIVSIP